MESRQKTLGVEAAVRSNMLWLNELARAARARLRPLLPLATVGAISAFALASSAEAAILHVSVTTGADSPTCGAQGSPCQNINQAVKIAASGDFIKMAGGTYTYVDVQPTCGASVTSIICAANKSLTIRGGYSPSTWVFNASPTIIDGQNTYRVAEIFSSISGVRVAMSNLTIQNGRALAPVSDVNSFGGGISVDGAAVTLTSMTFQNNQVIGPNLAAAAGGSAAGSALSIRSTVGGGVSLVSGVTFTGNSSVGGTGTATGGYAFGAMFVFAATVDIENSQFTNNTAQGGNSTGLGDSGGQRADALGGGIAVETGGNVSISRVTATGNTCTGGVGTQYGGGAFGGGVFVEDGSASIADSRFQSNVVQAGSRNPGFGGFAGGGGVLIFNSASASIDRSLFFANRATGGASSPGNAAGTGAGGGLYLWRGSPGAPAITIQVRNSVFAENIVQLGSSGTNPGGGGGGAQVQGLTAVFDHATFANNQLSPTLVFGQAVAIVEAFGVATTNVTLRYSAVTNHVTPAAATAVVVNQTNSLTFDTGSFFGNTHNTNSDNNPVLPGSISGLASMMSLNPSYVSPGSPNYNYHLQSGSALRDAASGSSMTLDMDYQGRSGVRDIGADEFSSATCTPGGGASDVDLDGIPDTVETTEATRPCSKDNDVFTSERLFTMQQYRDFLKREGDAEGIVVWMGILASGTPRADVTKAFFDSPEFQGTIAPVTRLYFAYFNRIPDLFGFEYWLAAYRSGTSLNDISQAFASSPEFIATYGSLDNTQFVTLVYQNVLGRAPDAPGLAYWVGQLNGGFMTRGQVMVGFSESPEYQQTSYNRVFVTMMYYGMLRRMPDQAGFDFWVGTLVGGASPLDLINGVLASGEYRGRFLPS